MKLSKINEEIKSLARRIFEIEEYEARNDFNVHGDRYSLDYIVANIKVYDWLDEDDVEEIIKNRNLEQFREDILDEFDDERLSNIHNHVCETEVNYIKDQYEALCHLNNYVERKNAYGLWLQGKDLSERFQFYEKYYLDEWKKFAKRKNNSKEHYWKYLYKKNKQEIDERFRLESFEREVWQFGRSGGWLSICKRDELENCEFDCHLNGDILEIEDNREFNEWLRDNILDYYGYYKSKSHLVRDMKLFISNWEEKLENIRWCVEQIEDSTEHFKSWLTEQLTYEIDTFIEEINVTSSNVDIEIVGDRVKTTLGISVDKDEFIDAYRLLRIAITRSKDEVIPFKKRVGNYFVQYAKRIENDILVKAGCHWFSLNNVEKVINKNRELCT